MHFELVVVGNMRGQANNSWSLSRISEFGYLRGHATKDELRLEVSTYWCSVKV